MTAILATNGFAAEQGSTEPKDKVGAEIYGTEFFYEGTDTYGTTVMPSGCVHIGVNGKTPVIASTWELKEGSKMSVDGNGFKLTGTININPTEADTVPCHCAIGDSGKLYYSYIDSNYEDYYKLTDDTDGYVKSDGVAPASQPDAEGLTLLMEPYPTGLPLYCSEDAQIDMAYDSQEGAVQGRICGGIVTYAPKNATILSKDSSTDLENTSLKDTKSFDRYTLAAATKDGFQEFYLNGLPILVCKDTKLNLTDSATYSGNVSDTSTLEGYLNSFGFYPNTTTVLDGTGYDLLATKGSDAAIQIPKNTKFSTAADSKTREIKANLHNVGSEAFTDALSFTGSGATNETLDTLVFSGDNSNLTPDDGVTYCDVNVTVCNANSWIVPKGENVTFGGTSNPTLKVDADMKISHNLTVKSGSKFEIEKGKTVKFFGTVTLGG